MKGFEPSTFCMASRRSSQLSYIRPVRTGPRVSVPAAPNYSSGHGWDANRPKPRARARADYSFPSKAMLTSASAAVFCSRGTCAISTRSN
jgi:hypothetical protein